MPWPWDPPPVLTIVSTTPHYNDNNDRGNKNSSSVTHMSDPSADYDTDNNNTSTMHSSEDLNDQEAKGHNEHSERNQSYCNQSLGDFGTVLSFLGLEKNHSSLRRAQSSAMCETPINNDAMQEFATKNALVGNNLWDLSMTMRYLQAYRTVPNYTSAAVPCDPPVRQGLFTANDSGPSTMKPCSDPVFVLQDEANMATSPDASVSHTDDRAAKTSTNQSQDDMSGLPGKDGTDAQVKIKRRNNKRNAQRLSIDEPTSSSNSGALSSESEHKEGAEPGSGPDYLSDDTKPCKDIPASSEQISESIDQPRRPATAPIRTTPSTVFKKKRPWRAARVLKEMKALFLAEQRETEQHKRQKESLRQEQQKRAASLGQVVLQKNELSLDTPGEELEDVLEQTPGCEPYFSQKPRTHYKNFWRLLNEQDPGENGPTAPSLMRATLASTTSTQRSSEENDAGKRLLAMRVRDRFLAPNGVSLLADALSRVGTDARPLDHSSAGEEDVTETRRKECDSDDDTLTKPTKEAQLESESESELEDSNADVAPSDRVFIFVDNSNILTGFYQHYQMHCPAAEKEQEPAQETYSTPALKLVSQAIQATPTAQPCTTPQESCDTSEKQHSPDTDSDEEIILYPLGRPGKTKDRKMSANAVKDSIEVTDVSCDTASSAPAAIMDEHHSKNRNTGTTSVRMVRGSHLLPKFDYNKFFKLLKKNRPTARQVLVGSSPLFQELDEALEYQYETIILRRVRKFVQGELGALPVPVKQVRFPSNTNNTAIPSTSIEIAEASRLSGANRMDSGQAETMTITPASALTNQGTSQAALAPTAAAANGEQGVDELLHLKMLETLLDHEPATMVLATGDGGDSEFGGGGFYGVIKRALDRGWQVEVVSWEDLLSGVYLDLALEYGYSEPDIWHRRRSHHHHHHYHHSPPKATLQSQKRPPYGSKSGYESRRQGHLRVWCLDWYGDLHLQK